jgi:hypothetical protein
MDNDKDLSAIKDEVFQKIGRNLVNFQIIELMLKHLIGHGRVAGYMSELKQIHEKKIEGVKKKTLGTLVSEFVETTFQSSVTSPEPTAELKEPYMSFSFSVEADNEFYENKKRELKSLVDDRNQLIHHLLPRFNPESLDSCLEIRDYLDQQRERLIPEYEYLKSTFESFEEIKKAHAAFLSSDEGKKAFELGFLQQSSIVQLLLNVSVQKPRPDGWTFLSVAIQQIRQILPCEMEQLNNRWGYHTLPDLMEASGYFDITKEELSHGSYRWVYRSKPALAYAASYRLIQLITDTANKTGKTDDWTSLAATAQQIEISCSQELSEVTEKHGCQSLYHFMVESDLFEWQTGKVDDVDNICYRLKQS